MYYGENEKWGNGKSDTIKFSKKKVCCEREKRDGTDYDLK
jgi:hypothetical protein